MENIHTLVFLSVLFISFFHLAPNVRGTACFDVGSGNCPGSCPSSLPSGGCCFYSLSYCYQQYVERYGSRYLDLFCCYDSADCYQPDCSPYIGRDGRTCRYGALTCTNSGWSCSWSSCSICSNKKTADCTSSGCVNYRCIKGSCGAQCSYPNNDCDPGYVCQQDCTCRPVCTSECSSGSVEYRCNGDTVQKRTCGDYNNDGCYEWSSWTDVTNCNSRDGYYCTGSDRCGTSAGDTRKYLDYSCKCDPYGYCYCDPSVTSSVDCACHATDSDSGKDYRTKGTCIDFTGCSGSSCQYTSYSDTCVNDKVVREYYVAGSSDSAYCAYTDYDCTNLGSNYKCDGGRCACFSECSSGSVEYRCNGDTVQKRTCGDYNNDGCYEWSSWTDVTNCNSKDGCYGGYYRDYSCSGGTCTYSERCTEACCDENYHNSNAYCSGGICYPPPGGGGGCTSDAQCPSDGWYDKGSWSCDGACKRCKPQEYRDYYCDSSTGACKYSVTQTRNYCENCPADTSCSAGSCSADVACLTGNYECKDACTKGQKQYRCDGGGNCNKFWQWITTSCSPFSCSAGSCTNTCSATCGADSTCDGKKPGDSCETGKACDSNCKCTTSSLTYTLTVSKSGTGSGTVNDTGINCGADCSESYSPGTTVTLTATPAFGSFFLGWSGDCSGKSNTCTLTMNSNKTVTANFGGISLTGSIAGTVKDSAGNPIAGASVSASGPSSSSNSTDSNGYYSISNLNSGSYTVTASATGYNSQSKTVSVLTGTTTTVNFDLTPVCNYNNICDAGETQACSDCKTFVSIYPTYTYPGQEVTITIYFNDSRFDVDKSDYDVKFDLFISNIPWNSTNGCDIGSKKLRSEMNCGCGTGGCKSKHGYYGSSEYWVDFTDGYAKITATCKIPQNIPAGTHTLKAVPVIYSSPTILTPGEVVFEVVNPLEKILLDLEARVISFLKKVTGFFILK